MTDIDGEALRIGRLDVFQVDEDTAAFGFLQARSDHSICSRTIPPGDYEIRFGEAGGQVPALWWPAERARGRAAEISFKAERDTRLGPLDLPPNGTIILERPVGVDFDAVVAVEHAEIVTSLARDEEPKWIVVDPTEWYRLDARRGPELHIEGVHEGEWWVRLCSSPDREHEVWRSSRPISVERHARVRVGVNRD